MTKKKVSSVVSYSKSVPLAQGSVSSAPQSVHETDTSAMGSSLSTPRGSDVFRRVDGQGGVRASAPEAGFDRDPMLNQIFKSGPIARDIGVPGYGGPQVVNRMVVVA